MTACLISIGQAVFAQDYTLDHVIHAVEDLEAAEKAYRDMGFTVRRGRLHENGLLNSLVEFADGTELELMSLAGAPGDSIARGYAGFLKDGPGGAFLSIRTSDLAATRSQLDGAEIAYHHMPGKYWDYLTFPHGSGLAHIFFIAFKAKSPARHAADHANGARGVQSIHLDAGNVTRRLFEAMELPSKSGGYLLGETCIQAAKLFKDESGRATGRPRIMGVKIRANNPIESDHQGMKVSLGPLAPCS